MSHLLSAKHMNNVCHFKDPYLPSASADLVMRLRMRRLCSQNEKCLLSLPFLPPFQLVNVHVSYLLSGRGCYAKLLCVVAVTFRRNSILMQACEHFKDPLAKCKCRSRNENEKGLCYLFYSCLLIPVSPLLHIFLFVGSARIDAIAMHN